MSLPTDYLLILFAGKISLEETLNYLDSDKIFEVMLSNPLLTQISLYF